MERLQAFTTAARAEGFVEPKESQDPNVVWLRNTLPDAGTDFHKRLCLDAITNSATVYWQTVADQCNSKTFRTVSSMVEWLQLHPHEKTVAKASGD
ncbi:MAG TPA: hypothetical protein VJX70_11745 [Candidatus Acidoferrum sp.]|nr:hypothetical protein [Candidatus Acidoferrum sp.]